MVYGGERIILTSRGKPKAAIIISIKDLHQLEEMEKTVDRRLYDVVKDELPWVKWLGNYDCTRRVSA